MQAIRYGSLLRIGPVDAWRAILALTPSEGVVMTVLLAYIHTPEGDAALRAALDEAVRRSTGAVVVSVTRPAAKVTPVSAEQGLDAIVALFRSEGVDVGVHQLPGGTDVAEGILGVAAATSPDVIVIGMRRRRPVGELIIGSTSQRILHGADCPVLAVKAPIS